MTHKLKEFNGLNKLLNRDMFDSWQEAVDYLSDLAHALFLLQDEEQRKRSDDTIEFLKHYIENNLHDDLSLTNLAEKVYLNPSYLSRFYHQAAGHKLSQFIEEARIRRAKELLEEGHEKIHEIAKNVGYETAASFTRFFKKTEGISPQEYRDAQISIKISKNFK